MGGKGGGGRNYHQVLLIVFYFVLVTALGLGIVLKDPFRSSTPLEICR